MVRECLRLARRSSECEAERFRYLWATAPPRLLIIRRGKLLSKYYANADDFRSRFHSEPQTEVGRFPSRNALPN